MALTLSRHPDQIAKDVELLLVRRLKLPARDIIRRVVVVVSIPERDLERAVLRRGAPPLKLIERIAVRGSRRRTGATPGPPCPAMRNCRLRRKSARTPRGHLPRDWVVSGRRRGTGSAQPLRAAGTPCRSRRIGDSDRTAAGRLLEPGDALGGHGRLVVAVLRRRGLQCLGQAAQSSISYPCASYAKRVTAPSV